MLHVAGERIVVISSPEDASKIFRDETSFAFDPFIDSLYRTVGNVSEEGNLVLWRTPLEGFTSLHPNPKGHVLVHTGNALLHKQLLDASNLQELTEKSLSYIERSLRWDSFFDSSVLRSEAETKVVSLHCLCRDVLLDAQVRAFFGKRSQELEP